MLTPRFNHPDQDLQRYDTAQVCPNGHVTNERVETMPQFNKAFCEKCGEKTLTTCPTCSASIRGDYLDSYGSRYTPPRHCNKCGHEFPWTERRIKAAIDLFVDEVGEGSEQGKEFEQSVRDLATDAPAAQVGANRIVRALKKLPAATASAIRDILVDIASETIKKTVFPGTPPS
jgi:hypothetical protein